MVYKTGRRRFTIYGNFTRQILLAYKNHGKKTKVKITAAEKKGTKNID